MALEGEARPDGLKGIIADTVIEVLQKQADRPLPPRRKHLREGATADYLGLDKGTLANWRSAGIGPKYRKIGARVIYDTDNLDAFIAQHPLHGSGRLDGGV